MLLLLLLLLLSRLHEILLKSPAECCASDGFKEEIVVFCAELSDDPDQIHSKCFFKRRGVCRDFAVGFHAPMEMGP